MKIQLLHVPDCPSMTALTERLDELFAGRPGVVIESFVVRSDEQAVRLGMTGSPTLLVDGVDPFAEPGSTPSVSCRLYRDGAGRLGGAPSLDALRAALLRLP